MKLRTVLVAAAAFCVHQQESVDSFAPSSTTTSSSTSTAITRPLDQHLSELRLSAATAAPPEQRRKQRNVKVQARHPEPSVMTRRKRLQVQQLERQYQRSPAQRNRLRQQQQQQVPSSVKTVKKSKPGLTRDEEVTFTHHIRTFRAAMRVREQLTTAAAAATSNSNASTNGSSNNNRTIRHEPSTRTWAAACGITPRELRRIIEHGQAARTAVVDANIGLVTNFAKRQYHALKQVTTAGGGVGTILTLQDMIQEGNLGLMEAAERFEPTKGFRFSTYATWWVRQRILRSISDSSRTIRLPAHVHAMLQKMRKARFLLQAQMGRAPSEAELATHLDISITKLQLYSQSSRNVWSLERPLHSAGSYKDENERTLGDTLASDAPTPEEDVQQEYLRRDLMAVMNTSLAESERNVIVHRFGLQDGKPRTVAETGELLGITIDRVRLVEARALNKLRHPQRNYKLKEYIHGEGNIPKDKKKTKKSAVPAVSVTGGSSSSMDLCEMENRQHDKNRIWFF